MIVRATLSRDISISLNTWGFSRLQDSYIASGREIFASMKVKAFPRRVTRSAVNSQLSQPPRADVALIIGLFAVLLIGVVVGVSRDNTGRFCRGFHGIGMDVFPISFVGASSRAN